MKYIAMLLMCVSAMFAQSISNEPDDVFVPKTLFAGTVMSASTASASLADTTRPIMLNGWNEVYLSVTAETNDSANALIRYQVSRDGVTWSALVTLDSLVATTANGVTHKGVKLPDNAMAYEQARFVVKGQSHGLYSANPSATLRSIIRKKQ